VFKIVRSTKQVLKTTANRIDVIKRHKNEPQICIPKSLVNAWEAIYGTDDLATTIFEIEHAVHAIDESRSRNNLARNDIPKEFRNHIHNKNFFQNDLGRFVQAAILVGHEINPIKYFKGSGTCWDGESPVKVISVLLIKGEDCHGHNLILLEVSYLRLCLKLVKNAIELLRILY
jgi:hypothetical protein